MIAIHQGRREDYGKKMVLVSLLDTVPIAVPTATLKIALVLGAELVASSNGSEQLGAMSSGSELAHGPQCDTKRPWKPALAVYCPTASRVSATPMLN